jgi:2-methylcitrate dehydratase PrpD
MGYLLARAMINGKVSLDDFTDVAVREQPILEFAKRVHMELNTSFADSSEGRPSKVEVRLRDGKTVSRYVEYAKGGPQAPLSARELRAKFVDCAHRVIDEKAVQGILDCVENLESLKDVGPLCRLLIGEKC